MPSSKEENKKDELINGLNSINKLNNEQQKLKNEITINNKKNENNNKGLNDEEYIEEEDEDDEDLDFISSANNELMINKKYLLSSLSNNENPLKKIKVPKLMVSLQKNPLSEEKLTERAKIKSEQEETLNILPESTLISTSQHILNNTLSKAKINIGNIGLSSLIKNNNLVEKSSNGMNTDNIDIKALNEDFSLKDSERKKIISEYYSKHLSEIIPNFLYISSYNATKNLELLEKNKITHIINCAADFCENVFEHDNKFTYLSFYLKDHVLENIECIFYECIKFIENVREKGGRVLVHCIQGISRSVSIVMAYIIFTKKVSYDKAFNLVQSKREISSPNFGFSIQLQNFYTRLYEDPSKYRYIPKIFAVGSFQNEQAGKIVCRLMNEPFYEHKENGLPRMLDKRGIFIIVSLTNVYLWLGSKISYTVKDIYLKTALEYVKILRQYEKAPQSPDGGGPIIVCDGKESDEFINDLLKTKEKISRFKRNISDIFPEWNSWYKEIKNVNNNELKTIMKDKNNNGNNSNENSDKNNYISSSCNETKKGFFLYPNDKSDAVLDFDDLNDETFLIACIYQKNKPKIYLWKGKLADVNENVYNEYKNKVSKIFFKQYGLTDDQCNEIENIIETPLEESDEFLSLI
jgi:protein-tyrosine phosphatase